MRTDGVWGFYPLVDRAEKVAWLVGLGVKTIQLRIKDLTGSALTDEIAAALQAAPGCQLYINDHWREALAAGATHVHLGQEDLQEADRDALRAVALGVSTHSFDELEEGLSWEPDYVALGPIYPTTGKQLAWEPQTPVRLRAWKKRVRRPLVAIGGITLERAPAVLDAGADAIAVIGDIQRRSERDAAARVEAWLRFFSLPGR